MLIAVPAAWSMAFAPTKRTKDILLWMLSTKMMPPVGVLVPIYLIYRDFGLLDTRAGLVLILCLGNLPIVIWMLFTYFKEIPKDILEAARMDGATIGRELDLCADADGDTRLGLDAAAQFHPGLERGVLDPEPFDARMPRRSRCSSRPIQVRKACSGRSCRRRRRLRSRRSSFSDGSASGSSSAA